MAIYRKENARYNSFQEFMAFSKQQDNHVSFSNLFSVKFTTPRMLLAGGGNFSSERFEVKKNLDLLLDYYADSVQLPSKQITTGQVATIGSPFKYATNTAFSQININFRIPRSMYSRCFFERWTQLMASDSEQYTRYYTEYVCPELIIYKWEKGGGDYVYTDPKMIRALRESGDDFLLARKYRLTGAYRLGNVFPYNIGSVRLDNQQAKALTMQIGFYYERYRFYTADQFDDPGVIRDITVPANINDNVQDTYTDSGTFRNNSSTQNEVFSRDWQSIWNTVSTSTWESDYESDYQQEVADGFSGGSNTAPSGQQYGPMASDARLKENIVKVGVSNDGWNIYQWNYIGESDRYEGVIAQEIAKIMPEAVTTMENGFLGVHYDLLDVDMRHVL